MESHDMPSPGGVGGGGGDQSQSRLAPPQDPTNDAPSAPAPSPPSHSATATVAEGNGSTTTATDGDSAPQQEAGDSLALASAADASNSNDDNNANDFNDDNNLPSLSEAWLKPNRMVFVARRMWAGSNSPGGLGHIEKIFTKIVVADEPTGGARAAVTVTHVDVKYLPSEPKTRDRGVPIQYVSDHNVLTLEIAEGRRGRRRNRENFRRCNNCGSFATDCGDCDWALEARVRRQARERQEEERQRLSMLRRLGLEDSGSSESDVPTTNYRGNHGGNNLVPGGDEDSDASRNSEDEELHTIIMLERNRKLSGKKTRNRLRRERRREKRKKKAALKAASAAAKADASSDAREDGNNDGEESSDDEIDITPLAVLDKMDRKLEMCNRLTGQKKIVNGEASSSEDEIDLTPVDVLKKMDRQLNTCNRITGQTKISESEKRKKRKRKKLSNTGCALGSLPSAGKISELYEVAATTMGINEPKESNNYDAFVNKERKDRLNKSNYEATEPEDDGHPDLAFDNNDIVFDGEMELEQDDDRPYFGFDDNHVFEYPSEKEREPVEEALLTPREGYLEEIINEGSDAEKPSEEKQNNESSFENYTDVSSDEDVVLTGLGNANKDSGKNEKKKSGKEKKSKKKRKKKKTRSGDDDASNADNNPALERERNEEINDNFASDDQRSGEEDAQFENVFDRDDDDNEEDNEVSMQDFVDLPSFIKRRMDEIKQDFIPKVRGELSTLRRRFEAVSQPMTKSVTARDKDVREDMETLLEKSNQLNVYIVTHLHRNGIDQCVAALKRLFKERRRNSQLVEKLSGTDQKQFRETAITLLDLLVTELNDEVKDVDAAVTKIWKEVDEMVQEFSFDGHGSGNDHGNTKVKRQRQRKRQKGNNSTKEKEWDRHQHATSRKRKQLSSRQAWPKSNNQQNRQHGNSRNNQNDDGDNASSVPEAENRLLSPHRSAEGDDNAFLHNESADVDFTGETDDFDDQPGSVLPLSIGGGAGHAASRRRDIREHFDKSSETAKRSRVKSAFGSRRSNNDRNSVNHQHQRGVASNDRASNGNGWPSSRRADDRSMGGHSGNQGMPLSTGLAPPSARATHARQSNSTRRQQGGSDGMPRSTNNAMTSKARQAVGVGETALPTCRNIRPAIPNALNADLLFNSLLSPRWQEEVDAAATDHQMQHSDTSDRTSVQDLCQALRESHQSKSLHSCHRILSTLTSRLLSKSEERSDNQNNNEQGPSKDDIVLFYRTLHHVFKTNCATLLDVIRTDADAAVFQMECWILCFRTLVKKWNRRLDRTEDGVLHKIFGNSDKLVHYVVLQIIDALYSQLLYEEYGMTPTFDQPVFDSLRVLCVRIGRIVPLLPVACGTLLLKLRCTRWQHSSYHMSEEEQQKNNEPKKNGLYVSAIDPEMHRRFIFDGEIVMPKENLRMGSFKQKIPREEIAAAWSIIGFCSSSASTATSSASLFAPKPDYVQPQKLLNGMILYSVCGTLPKVGSHDSCLLLPPTKLQVNACSTEIKRVCTLFSLNLLGELPSMTIFSVEEVVRRGVMLESFDEVLNHPLLKAYPVKVNRAVKQLWQYSCITTSRSAVLEHDLQSGLTDFDLISGTNNNTTISVYGLLPSTILLQRCVSLVSIYAGMMIKKNPRWKTFRDRLDSLAGEFVARAIQHESKKSARCQADNSSDSRERDVFAEMFESIESATKMQSVHQSLASSHLREAACYVMLAGLLARSRHNVPGKGKDTFNLNKVFIEKIWEYSSDESMRRHQKQCHGRILGDTMAGSNICLLYMSSKVITLASLLHLRVCDFTSGPHQITESLHAHLVAVKVDDDASMEFLVECLISNLLSSCDMLDSLNQRGRISEQEDKCKAHLESSKTCVGVVRSINMWLNLIFGRAKFILELPAKATSSHLLVQLARALKKLGNSKFFLLIMQSLTKALSLLIDTATKNAFSKAMANDGCLEQAFRSTLGAIRNSIALLHSCGINTTPVMQNMGKTNDWEDAVLVYLLFMKTKFMPSTFDTNEIGEHRKLCRNQSGGVLGVLASLCSISQAQRVLIDVYDVMEPRDRIKDDDRFFLSQMSVCFTCELARLAQHNGTCKAIATQHSNRMIKHVVTSLLDPDTMTMFPTCNLTSLSQYDSHNSRSKGSDALSKLQNHSLLTCQDPDQEAYKIKRVSGDYFDTVGPTYASKNVWSLCENVGQLLSGFDDKKYSLQMWAKIRTIGKEMINVCKKLQSDKDLLELLPQVSVERESLKRLIFFQELFAMLKRNRNEDLDLILSKEGGVLHLTSIAIIENLYYLSGIELELEEQRNIGCDDSDSRYQRAKALTFQKAYIELSSSLMVLMLRENMVWSNMKMCDLVRHQVIVSTFKGRLDIRSAIESEALNFDLCLRRTSSKGRVIHMTQGLLSSFSFRAGELLSYATRQCDGADSFGQTLFNAMLHATTLDSAEPASTDSLFTIISHRLVLMPRAAGEFIQVTSDGLQRAIDNYLLHPKSGSCESLSDQKLMLSLREWVLDIFFVHLLKSQDTSTDLRAITLTLLTCIIKTYSSKDFPSRQKLFNSNGNLASIITYAKLFHSLKECFCLSIRSDTLDAPFIKELFHCAHQFLTLPVCWDATMNESTPIIHAPLLSQACTSSTNSNISGLNAAHIAYIYEASMWLDACGQLLRNQASKADLGRFLDETDANNTEIISLINLEKSLSLGKATHIHSSNPYAQNRSNTVASDAEGCGNNPLSKESLEAINEFSHGLISLKNA